MKRLLFGLIITCIPFSAVSGTATGKIVNLLVHKQGGNGAGVFMFEMDGSRAGAPACSTIANGKAWAMSLEQESGRAMYSLVLAAYSSGKTITVNGSNTCDSWGDREEPIYIRGL